MGIVVKWGRERLHFPLPPPNSKIGQLRHEIAEYTQLPEQSFKLIHAGAIMKDDSAPVSAYGIKAGSTIALIGGGEPLPHAPSKASSGRKDREPRTEQSTINQIRTELDKVRSTLRPDVESFLHALAPTATQAQASPSNTGSAPLSKPASSTAGRATGLGAELEQEHLRLGELLLQSLLRLDALNAEGEWEDARRERKGAVKEVQGLLDRLDGGWRARQRS
ncbi:hypothetical protein GY45DRAFT_1278454 [Cubamyces sp. BRFM 1775]|nr:hypothetical protein GY45DRAFT_1278454 [Cubamyces sp. BRFM 1775]